MSQSRRLELYIDEVVLPDGQAVDEDSLREAIRNELAKRFSHDKGLSSRRNGRAYLDSVSLQASPGAQQESMGAEIAQQVCQQIGKGS